MELLYRYHNMISKGKFNLGWTDVVEYKIDLTNDDTEHIRQFMDPLMTQAEHLRLGG